jgi:hypothetical protein
MPNAADGAGRPRPSSDGLAAVGTASATPFPPIGAAGLALAIGRTVATGAGSLVETLDAGAAGAASAIPGTALPPPLAGEGAPLDVGASVAAGAELISCCGAADGRSAAVIVTEGPSSDGWLPRSAVAVNVTGQVPIGGVATPIQRPCEGVPVMRISATRSVPTHASTSLAGCGPL